MPILKLKCEEMAHEVIRKAGALARYRDNLDLLIAFSPDKEKEIRDKADMKEVEILDLIVKIVQCEK